MKPFAAILLATTLTIGTGLVIYSIWEIAHYAPLAFASSVIVGVLYLLMMTSIFERVDT